VPGGPSTSGMVVAITAPSGACTAGSPAQVVSSTGAIYTCQSGTWGSVSGGSNYSNENLAFSSTPTFSTATSSSRIALSGNITTFTLSSGLDGQPKCLNFAHDATANTYTVTPPANVRGFMTTVGSAASKNSSQCFNYFASDAAWIAISPGVINQ
jgi:hypothetical protein